MKKKKRKVLNDDYKLYKFKQDIFYNEDTLESFINAFKNDKSICGNFYKMYINDEITLTFKKVYKAYYYINARVEDAKYTFLKETLNEFNEKVIKTDFGTINYDVKLYDNELFKNNLLYNDTLLYEIEEFHDYITENDFKDENKTLPNFLEEYNYKLVYQIHNNLYEKHQILESSKIEKIILDPISDIKYEERKIFLEPAMEISFDYIENNKVVTYKNYVSMVTKRLLYKKSFPRDVKFKEFYKRNKPPFFTAIKFSKDELNYYIKEKYNLSLIVDEEFNKLMPEETIKRALLYLNEDKITEGLLYIKKAFYLYNSKKVTGAFLHLAKFYLTKNNFNYEKALYYLNLCDITAEGNFYMAQLYFNGLIRGISYIPDGFYHLKQAAKYGDYNSSIELYHHYSSFRYQDKKQAAKYFKLADKYKKK